MLKETGRSDSVGEIGRRATKPGGKAFDQKVLAGSDPANPRLSVASVTALARLQNMRKAVTLSQADITEQLLTASIIMHMRRLEICKCAYIWPSYPLLPLRLN